MRGIGLAIAIATIGALGNALFVYGQRRAHVSDAPFVFVTLYLIIATTCCFLAVPFLPKTNVMALVTQNFMWAFWTGLGLAVTMISFYFLYTHFGATFYALYSVISILTTTLLVGQILLREPINIFHVGAIILAVGSVLLFTLGRTRLSA